MNCQSMDDCWSSLDGMQNLGEFRSNFTAEFVNSETGFLLLPVSKAEIAN
jgi:hypothetical protein